MTKVKCEKCGEEFDTADCNQVYAIYTKVIDSDEHGTKKVRVYLCGLCDLEIQDLISAE